MGKEGGGRRKLSEKWAKEIGREKEEGGEVGGGGRR